MKYRSLRALAVIISASMFFVFISTAVNADEIGNTEPAEQTDVEPVEPTEPSQDTEPVEPTEETVPDETAPDETIPDESIPDETIPDETDETDPTETSETTDPTEPSMYGLTFINDDLIEVSTYEALTAALSQISYGGTIKLINDISTEAMIEIPIGRNIVIDLNGFDLDRKRVTPDCDGHVIIVNSGAILTVRDSRGTGCITGGFAQNGGGINNKGNLYLEGVTICGNWVNKNDGNGRGAGIYNNGILVISDCVICDNEGDNAGGIYNDTGGVITMTNTAVTNNTSSAHGGGGIVNSGYLNLAGNCTITGNHSRSNGGGLWNDASVHMCGCNYICNNTSDYDTNNIFLKTGTVIDIDYSISGELWVSTESPVQTITRGWISTDDVNVFKLDNGCSPSVVDGEVRVGTYYVNRYWDGTAVVSEECNCPETVRKLTEGPLTSGWYYVSDYQRFDVRVCIETGHTVNLILADGSYLVMGSGIEVPPGATLNIYGQRNDSGELIASNTGRDACIGATKTGACGAINIYGGIINANPRYGDGTGIGGGDCSYYSAKEGGDGISIYGGEVYGQGCDSGAGIGGGKHNCGPAIYIYGGHVEGYGGWGGAGIGGGVYGGCPSAIVINGGEVIACGGSGASGIGEGYDPTDRASRNSVITINGGTVSACGGKGGAGIGGGHGCNTGVSIVINDGDVEAIAGTAYDEGAAAGIGAGSYMVITGGGDYEGTITIRGGNIHAEGSGYISGSDYCGGAGIGAGNNGDMTGTINIEDGIIECIGRGGGAPIGGGYNYSFGYGDMSGTVNINRGYIILQDASYRQMSKHPQLIGHGADADVSGTLNLASGITVWYSGQVPVEPSQRSTVLRGSTSRQVFINGF